MKPIFDKIFGMPVYVHLLAVAALSCIIGYAALEWTDYYTNHNQAVHVPDVRGLQIEEAEPFFEQQKLNYTVIDSVFSKEAQPGAVVELLPEANSKVKKNRTIYVTVNARTEKTAPLPEIYENTSFREAYAMLKALGFRDVEHRYVAGEDLNRTLGFEYEGREVKSGDRIPLSAKLYLIVSNGNQNIEDAQSQDSIEIITSDDSWF